MFRINIYSFFRLNFDKKNPKSKPPHVLKMPRRRATARTPTQQTEEGVKNTKGVTKRRRANTKRKVRIIPVLPMLSRNVYKRLNKKGSGNKGQRCGDLTWENTVVPDMRTLIEIEGVTPVLKATRRRAARKVIKLVLRQLMHQHDPETFPLSSQDKEMIDATGLSYFVDNARKIKEDAKPDNKKFETFWLDVSDTVPNVSEQASKSLSAVVKTLSETILESAANLAFKGGQQTISSKQIHCVERLTLGPRSGHKMAQGKYDLSRCPSNHRILSSMSTTTTA